MVSKDEEYKALRQEMMTARRIQSQVAIASPTLTLAYLGVLLSRGFPQDTTAALFLLPIPILACTLLFIFERRRTIFRVAKYMAIFYENDNDPGWERRLQKYYHKMQEEGPVPFLFQGSVFQMAFVMHSILVVLFTGLAAIAFFVCHFDWVWFLLPGFVFVFYVVMCLWILAENKKMPDAMSQRWSKIKYDEDAQKKLLRCPFLTVDTIVKTPDDRIVLIKRKNPPFGWAIPGGFVEYGESLEAAAARETKEEIGVDVEELKQFKAYSDPNRDPRQHTVTVVFTASTAGSPMAGSDTEEVGVFAPDDLPSPLAFDHQIILADYFSRKS